MKSQINVLTRAISFPDILLAAGGIALIYFVPALAHMTGVPLYMAEPMRIILILSMVHASKYTSCVLAATLPLLSWIFSGHPELVKMLIITGELLLNVSLFYLIYKRLNNPLIAILASIIISKILCYLAYWPVFSFAFMVAEAHPLFLVIQIITTVIFSFYVTLSLKKQVA